MNDEDFDSEDAYPQEAPLNTDGIVFRPVPENATVVWPKIHGRTYPWELSVTKADDDTLAIAVDGKPAFYFSPEYSTHAARLLVAWEAYNSG